MTKNRRKKVEIKERNKIIMDNAAREKGYTTWNAYCRKLAELEKIYGHEGFEAMNHVPIKPGLPLLEIPAVSLGGIK